MGELEQHILQNALGGLIAFEWIRLIDDIFAIWSHRTDKLNTNTLTNQCTFSIQEFTLTNLISQYQISTLNPLTEHSYYTMIPFIVTPLKQVSYTVKLYDIDALLPIMAYHKHLDNLRIILITRGYSQYTPHFTKPFNSHTMTCYIRIPALEHS